MAGNLRGVAEEGEERAGEEEASATTYFFSPESCPTIGEGTPDQTGQQNKVRILGLYSFWKPSKRKRKQWLLALGQGVQPFRNLEKFDHCLSSLASL